jgi:gamma-glutamyl:cysteine ligase YbdK (ATP-grasp superfamily)
MLPLWIAFSLGAGAGALVASHYLGKCQVRIVDADTAALESAATAALTAAMTGSGAVSFDLDPAGIRVHADSLFENQSYDTRILAVVRGAPVTVEVSAQLLRRMLAR